jgi:hypothetical protein
MQSIEIVIFTVLAMAAVAGLSVALYTALPKSVLACGARHGRFAGLIGARALRDGGQGTPAVKTEAAGYGARAGQSA